MDALGRDRLTVQPLGAGAAGAPPGRPDVREIRGNNSPLADETVSVCFLCYFLLIEKIWQIQLKKITPISSSMRGDFV